LPLEDEGRLKTAREYLAKGKAQEAVKALEELLARHPRQARVMTLLAVALQKLPHPDFGKARILLCEAVRLAPEDAGVHLLLGQLYIRMEEESLALSEFQQALKLSRAPATLVPAHLGLMALYQKRGQAVEAQQEFAAACKLAPEIKGIMEQEEIRQVTPAPIFVDDESGTHPSLEERIKNLQMKRKGKK